MEWCYVEQADFWIWRIPLAIVTIDARRVTLLLRRDPLMFQFAVHLSLPIFIREFWLVRFDRLNVENSDKDTSIRFISTSLMVLEIP